MLSFRASLSTDTDRSSPLAEALYDANLETEHHLQVARLHREVYNKPLDLQARLAQIKQAEAEQWSHLTSSQASSSNAGTPTKVSGPSSLSKPSRS